ncbi:type IIL restriction-modification enzyme MmeI [Bradyrhizobium sp. CIR3A]|uniref:type IIL restriction-modification enzyme MmeI n=1 Tax=Bradyrhizobium sp. CIR3A TaxID=2663838 RepID=UPI00160658FC|nr:type IIL restriction-modification enzyme MmeI [Bradyrhizobium sp. CIR3A]MBB4263568.1 hypothetical protein [Bradyrhizobium sp. CIR3A]
MIVPPILTELIERFENNREEYTSARYNEAQTRREFIDPLFRLLGWDIDNTSGYAEAYKDVLHEDSLKIGDTSKAPDYGFRIGGTRKFFLEAKRPSINISDDADSAYQLRRYAWSAKLPISILTNFKTFSVYDCRIKPEKSDKASVARILHLQFSEYADKWGDLTSTFSREAILKTKSEHQREVTSRMISEIDRRIDNLVAKLFKIEDSLADAVISKNTEDVIASVED